MSSLRRPRHPGEKIKKEVSRRQLAQRKRGASVTYFARVFRMSRSALSRVMNGRTPITARLAVCLARAFKVSAESWLRMQAAYDLWHARKRLRRKKRTVPFSGTVRITGRIQLLA
jgi:antitoxin HigA-1